MDINPEDCGSHQKSEPESSVAFRTERDMIGAREIPLDVYWGVHTKRALENFPISGRALSNAPELVHAMACVKEAAANANHDLGLLKSEFREAIVRACREIRNGGLPGQFPVDLIQGGAGTSSNMNMNEVVANRALEYLKCRKGDYDALHPNDHVNLSQSTNDVYPTSIKIAAIVGIDALLEVLKELRFAFEGKADEFTGILKIGRTQLQDAVPMTLGQEFQTYAIMLEEDEARLREARELLLEINLGATAIGTGIASHPEYAECAREHLVAITGLPLVTAPNLIASTQDCGAFVQASGVLKAIAVKISKICNDLRLLSSGPRAGFAEITLSSKASWIFDNARQSKPGHS